jgi:hypothetical protein
VYPVELVDKPVIWNQLQAPSILQAMVNSSYGYTTLKTRLGLVERFILESEGIILLSRAGFENWIQQHPVSTDKPSPLLQKLEQRAKEGQAIWRFQFPLARVADPLMWKLSRENGLAWSVYHAIVVGENGYVDLRFVAPEGVDLKEPGIEQRREQVCAAAAREGVHSYLAPCDGQHIWCDNIRQDVRQALQKMLGAPEAESLPVGQVEMEVRRLWLDNLVKIVEKYYPYFPGSATRWGWLNWQEFEEDRSKLESRIEQQKVAYEKEVSKPPSEFISSLAEFRLLGAMEPCPARTNPKEYAESKLARTIQPRRLAVVQKTGEAA